MEENASRGAAARDPGAGGPGPKTGFIRLVRARGSQVENVRPGSRGRKEQLENLPGSRTAPRGDQR